MNDTAFALRAWRSLSRFPLGPRLFTRAVCLKAPYFGSIGAQVVALEPGRCEATLRLRRSIRNHVGSIHAIALCNLAELVGGIATEASIPTSQRWIPKGMQVRYLKKALGTVRAVATLPEDPAYGSEGFEMPVSVVVVGAAGEAVFEAVITMWISPKPATSPAVR